MTAVIVIPIYNEAEAIAGVVAGARRYAPVIVVDDGSSDTGAVRAEAAGADVVRHARRCGKAAALRTGFTAARARGASAVVTLDGDGQHAPGDVPILLRAARETPDQLVVGNRLGESMRFPRARRNAMAVAAFFVEWVSELGLRDTQSGFRAYPVALLDDVPGSGEGFVFETEVLIAAARRGWRVREVVVSSIPTARRRSRFRPVRDGLSIGIYLAGQVLRRWRTEIAVGRRGRPLVREQDDGERRRRARAVALAMAASPILLVATLVQAGLGRLGLDVVTPLVRRLYACDRLAVREAADRGQCPSRIAAIGASADSSGRGLAPSRAHRS